MGPKKQGFSIFRSHLRNLTSDCQGKYLSIFLSFLKSKFRVLVLRVYYIIYIALKRTCIPYFFIVEVCSGYLDRAVYEVQVNWQCSYETIFYIFFSFLVYCSLNVCHISTKLCVMWTPNHHIDLWWTNAELNNRVWSWPTQPCLPSPRQKEIR